MNRYLDMVDGPAHVKKLTPPQLEKLAEEIRQELITGLAKAGGHLGPNLGVVELTLALHNVFSTPKDKFVWDVSHQVYVHKILTGRKDRFHTIRQTDGLNGFALRTESPHDCFGAGHAGTAHERSAGMDGRAVGAQEHFVEGDGGAHLGFEGGNANCLARLGAELHPAGANNGVSHWKAGWYNPISYSLGAAASTDSRHLERRHLPAAA